MNDQSATDGPDVAEHPHRSIAERFIDGRSAAGGVTVSPDGAHVAFVVSTTDLGENSNRSAVWLDDAPVTAGPHDGAPTFSPDGRYLAFTSRRGEKQGDSTLHVLPVAGPGEVRTVCTMPDGLGDVAWSPDGSWLAFASRTRDARYDAKDESWQPPRKIETFFSRLNGENWIFDRPQHVYAVPADGTGEPINLTPGPHQHSGVSWLADSSGVVTSAQRHDNWDRDHADDLYAVSLPSPGGDDDPEDRVRCLTAHDGVYHSPAVSPDGSSVAFVGSPDPMTFPQNDRVGILPVSADGADASQIRWISTGLDRTFASMSCASAPTWESDSALLAAADDRGGTHLYRLHIDRSEPDLVVGGALAVTSFDTAGDTLATTRTVVDRPAEVFIGDERRTQVSDRFSNGLLRWEHFTVSTSDGTGEIDCWLMRPVDLDETGRHPLLYNVHGGPFAQYGEGFFDEFQMQSAAGFVVLCCNPRGGSGRHAGWGQALIGPNHPTAPGTGWGSVDVDDVLSALDGTLARFSFVDPDRVGMLGGSYGGFMATWLAANHGERFQAICSERAANNLVSLEHSSDISTAFQALHGQSHLDAPEEYARMSPSTMAERIDTPMLLIHSEEDWRCPIAQAEELWVALRLRHKDVEFYRFPGENHELSRAGSPVHRVQRAEIILDWFADKLSPS